ncbi:MAG: Rho termination factor N-terminal domain-containing protein, partial [Firmicutes bacterium]|nr:Rho termination factor N-terminal domain-containing protein [Bacillota bacterium]
MKNFTKEELQEMGIYELRELARSFSIHRPSDKKRTDLITLILESPHMANYQELPSYVKLFEYQSALDFASDMPSRVACPGSYESHIATGYVHTSTSGGFLVASNLSSYRLTSSFMSMNNLAQCDYVDVRADFDNDRKGFVATDLIERKSQPQRRFDAMPGLRPIRKMDFGGVKMPVGGRALVTCDKTYPRYEHISDICTQLKNGPFAKNVIKIAIIAEENDFVVNYLTEKGINEIFFIKPDMPISKQLASCLY